ncbi:translocator protein-like [Hemiscyllium ocellatum]|uniref:translocator protein-like n=1 Tax=Hemiscyllium ocellatum TaxID=170820 RepID=UPI002966A927|nr:translocator protein-like [Hemiscyllium ocellatum]
MAPVWAQIVGFATLPHVGGLLGWYLGRSQVPTWFEQLKKPWWRPPNKIIPVVWTALYTGMGYASYLIWRDLGGFTNAALIPLGLYGTQLTLNWAFSVIFFGTHNLSLALIEAFCLYGSVVGTMVSWYPINKTATLLMAPYLAWLTLATALTYCIWRDNPDKKKRS